MLNVNLRTPYIRFDKRSGHAYLSFNHGKFASVYGIKKNDSIRLQREKKNGYREEYKAHQYKITDRRKDYGSDAVFANFREIRTTGMARNILYRGHVTVDMTSEQFGREIIPILRFMIEHPAPYYLHCNTGKDRTGLLCAIVEALMGASYKEIISSNQDKVNPAEAAARYLKQFGMTDTEIHALKIRLSTTE